MILAVNTDASTATGFVPEISGSLVDETRHGAALQGWANG
jgi:hypothetical protein